MNLDQRKLSIGLVLIYIVCVLITAYTLFTLQNDLIYKAQALTTSELGNAQPVFWKLYLVIGITTLVGVGVLLYLFNNKGMEIIYVEKKEEEKKKKNKEEKDKEDDSKTFDISSIHGAISSKTKSEEKLLADSLTEICKALDAGVGAFYMLKKDGSKSVLQMNATYAMSLAESQRPTFELGEGLVGQVGMEKQGLVVDDIPEGYIKVVSGLGSSSPTHIIVCPVMYGKELWGVVEIAAFTAFNNQHIEAIEKAFDAVTEKIFAKKTEAETKAPSKAKSESTKKGTKKA